MKGLCGLRSAPPNSALSCFIMSLSEKAERSTVLRMLAISFFSEASFTCSGPFFTGTSGRSSPEESDSDSDSDPLPLSSSSEDSSPREVMAGFFLAFLAEPPPPPPAAAFFLAPLAPLAFFFFLRSVARFLLSFFFVSAAARSLSDMTLGRERKSRMRLTLPSFFASSPFPRGRSKVSSTKFSSSTVYPSSFCVSFSTSAAALASAYVNPEKSKMLRLITRYAPGFR
mmetsp:Transcript_5229/g.11167  ORF Transcript_5229/g.11167 Transcript_5229/m.11167 type:complete len:227 (-) Transcript_5229:489-1169(-)